MKEKKFKIKKLFKNKIFFFVLISVIFGITVGASATTLLYSKDVTYDNSISGLSSTNLQDALDELYEQAKNGGASVSCDDNGNCTVTCKQGTVIINDNGYSCPTIVTCPSGTYYEATSTGYSCKRLTASEKLIKNVVTSGSGLYKDSVESGRYIYRGPSPSNYITFNSETWRIMSVESDGTIKIIRQDSIGIYVWDTANSRSTAYCNISSYGCNSWGSSTTTFNSSGTTVTSMPRAYGGTAYTLPTAESTLNEYLNGTYYNTLSSTAQSQIVSHMFNISVLLNSNTQTTTNDVKQESTYKWKGKIALANASEYIRTSTNSNCTGVYAMYNNSSCYNNSSTYNWMYYSSSSWWTLSPLSNSDGYPVWYVDSDGRIHSSTATGKFGVRPVVFLSSDITLSGSGTSSDPYQIVG